MHLWSHAAIVYWTCISLLIHVCIGGGEYFSFQLVFLRKVAGLDGKILPVVLCAHVNPSCEVSVSDSLD